MTEPFPTEPFLRCIDDVTFPAKIQKSDFMPTGRFPIISQEESFINGYWNDPAALLRVKRPLVVFGDHTKVLKFIDFDFVLGADGVKVLQPKAFLEPKFFYYWLQSLDLKSLGYARHYKLLKEQRVPRPPLSEQHRIVAILDKAFESIAVTNANAKKNLENARELFESALVGLFDINDAERVTLATLLERGWIDSHLDGNHGSYYPRKEEFVNSGVPYLSANCLDADTIDFPRAKYLSRSRAAKIKKGVAKTRDVLFAHNATVGPVALLITEEPKVILGTSLTYYRCNEQYILPEYLAHYMRSREFISQYKQVMRQSTRNQVPITIQREFYHVVPSLPEQRRIANALDALRPNIDHLSDLYSRKLCTLQELKSSLLHAAFSGEV